MKEKLGCAAALVYLGVGAVQVLAIIKGIQFWSGMPWIVSTFLSLIVAYIPVLGTIAGIKGAMSAWGWNLWPAVAFFCWPYALFLLAAAVGGIVDLMSRGKDS